MLTAIKSRVSKLGKSVLTKKLKKEYEAQTYSANERAVEYRFVFECLQKVCPKTVLDVGTGLTSLPHLMSSCGCVVTATDNIYEYWSKSGMYNRHFYLINDDITKTQLKDRWDMVTCVSTLEHIKNHPDAVQNMLKLVKPGGHLVMSFPYNENKYVPNAYELPGAVFGENVTYICQVYSRAQLDAWLKAGGGRIVTQEYWQCFDGEFWTLGNFIHPPRQVTKDQKHHLTCLLIQKT